MKNVIFAMCALTLMAAQLTAQTGFGSGSGSGGGRGDQATAQAVEKKVAETQAIAKKVEEAQPNPRFVRTLTNVQIELTLTDQTGSGAPDKKTVSMVVSSGNWGKIRSAGNIRQVGEAPYTVDLGVDARPFVSVDGPIQLELTLNYSPPGDRAIEKKGATREDVIEELRKQTKPTGINQSMTVVLQSGKPVIISQAADPASDRKVIVEVKATVLK